MDRLLLPVATVATVAVPASAQTLDPTKAADALASGNTQTVLASVAVFFALVSVTLGTLLYKMLIGRAERAESLVAANTDTNKALIDLLRTAKAIS